jgi:hypothetical protein
MQINDDLRIGRPVGWLGRHRVSVGGDEDLRAGHGALGEVAAGVAANPHGSVLVDAGEPLLLPVAPDLSGCRCDLGGMSADRPCRGHVRHGPWARRGYDLRSRSAAVGSPCCVSAMRSPPSRGRGANNDPAGDGNRTRTISLEDHSGLRWLPGWRGQRADGRASSGLEYPAVASRNGTPMARVVCGFRPLYRVARDQAWTQRRQEASETGASGLSRAHLTYPARRRALSPPSCSTADMSARTAASSRVRATRT